MDTKVENKNKAIAKFDGKNFKDPANYFYDMSWNMLMQVVKKIGEIDNQADIELAAKIAKMKKGGAVSIFTISVFAPIQLFHDCVYRFIKFYNKYNKNA